MKPETKKAIKTYFKQHFRYHAFMFGLLLVMVFLIWKAAEGTVKDARRTENAYVVFCAHHDMTFTRLDGRGVTKVCVDVNGKVRILLHPVEGEDRFVYEEVK